MSPVAVTSLEGLGGIGKSAIAQHIAWQAVEGSLGREFDAVVWVEDRDGDLTLDKLIDTTAKVIEYPYLKSLEAEEKVTHAIHRLAEIPSLLVIENYETIRDPRIPAFLGLLPSNQTKALITTREHLFSDAWTVGIGGLPRFDADALLKQEVERLEIYFVLDAPAPLTEQFYEITGGNPLAIRLSIGSVRQRISSFADVITSLRGAEPGELFDSIFKRTWNQVLLNDEYTLRVLTVMALHASSVSRAALEAGADVHSNSLTNAIGRLVELSLIDRYEDPQAVDLRYKIHPLTRSFVSHQRPSEVAMVSELEERLVKYYLRFTARHKETYASIENIRALEQERTNFLTFAQCSYDRAVRHGYPADWEYVIGYADNLTAYLWGRGYWRDQLNLCRHAVEGARSLNNSLHASRHLAFIGRVYLWLGDVEAAKEHLSESELAAEGEPSELVKSVPKRLHAQIASREGDYDLARDLLTDVLNSASITADDEGRAATLVDLGVIATRQKAWLEAKSYFEEALRLDEELESLSLEGQAVSLSHLGNAQFAMTEYQEAERSFMRGLLLAIQIERLSTKGRCQYGLAQVNIATGDVATSGKYAKDAVESFSRLGMRDMVEEAQTLAARTRTIA
jgi:tetratricopeptide (TPR) repeat protein